jgi:Outer membrane protein beta-barrel domain
MKKLIFSVALLLAAYTGNAQVIISLLLGDKLNTGKIEFGLDGGLTLSDIQGLDGAKSLRGFNLGFYFDIKLKNPAWMFNTGVLVKSPMGAEDLPVYSLNDPDLDNVFAGGEVTKKLRYFNVPLMMKYQFKNHFFAKAGIQLGLMNKAFDEFSKYIEDEEASYKIKTKELYHPLDAGLAFGLGYRLMGGNGMNIGIQYYLGLVDILIDDNTPDQTNRAFYLNLGIPIGKGSAKKKAEQIEK